MQRIIIRNFGPVKDIDLEISQILVFIGQQASGKSTISKSIYFFKSLRNDVLKYLLEAVENNNFDRDFGNIGKRIRSKFLDFWGTTVHLRDIHLEYHYGNEKSITINLRGKYINPVFSSRFKKELRKIISDVESNLSQVFKINNTFLSSSELLSIEQQKKNYFKRIEELTNVLFEDDKDLLFIPAGRSLLTVLSEQLQYIQQSKLDYIMRAFIDRINATKPLFFKSLDDLINDKINLSEETIKFGFINAAKRTIEKILKGRYINDSEGEKLFIDKTKYVKINYSSSGQQEVIWILNMIFINMLNNNKVFVVFEEPETHLYPEAQKEIIDLIALLLNSLKAHIIITTHSPYILSSLNNLVYASTLASNSKKEVNKIINEKFHISPKDLSVFMVKLGEIENIIDEDTKLIKTEAIDSASLIINDVFNKLFEFDEK